MLFIYLFRVSDYVIISPSAYKVIFFSPWILVALGLLKLTFAARYSVYVDTAIKIIFRKTR